MHVPLQLHVPWLLHGIVVIEPHWLHAQLGPHRPGLHWHVPHVHDPCPLHGASVVVGHAAVEHAHVGPDHPGAHAHWPVEHSHAPPLAHTLAQPWHATHSGAPFTVVPYVPAGHVALHTPPALKNPPPGAHCEHEVAEAQLAQPVAHGAQTPSKANVPDGHTLTQLPPLRTRPAAHAVQSVLALPVQLAQVAKQAWHAPLASTYVDGPQLVTHVVPLR